MRAPKGGILLLFLLLVLILAFIASLREAGPRPHRAARHATTGGGARTGGCYPAKLMQEAIAVVRRGRGYAPPSEEERRAYTTEAARLSAKYGTDFPARALESVRSQERALRARGRVAAFRKNKGWASKLAAGRRQGLSVTALAARHDLPPMFVLKALRGHKAEPSEEEGRAAALGDEGSALHQHAVRAQAAGFEEVVGAALARLGAPHETEAEARAAGRRSTPDFLLSEPTEICGRRVVWLDAKNYLYYGNRLTLPGLKKQVRKYTAEFGPGALVFAGGVACGSPPLGALVLGPDLGVPLVVLPALLAGAHEG